MPEKFVALIYVNQDCYDRYFVKSSDGETKERFLERMKNCYGDDKFEVEIYSINEPIE